MSSFEKCSMMGHFFAMEHMLRYFDRSKYMSNQYVYQLANLENMQKLYVLI